MKRILLSISFALFIGGMAIAGETLPKWSARIRLEGKGVPVAVEVSAKDRPAARKLIEAQYPNCAFTAGPTRIREKAEEK